MFKVHTDAKRWAHNLLNVDGPINTQFDIYYLSLIVGVGLGRSSKIEAGNVNDITKNVTEPYIEYRYALTGLLLVSELTNSGLPLTKELVKSKVAELLNSNSSTLLSDSAVELMNSYAYGGFEAMREKIPHAPPIDDFLIWYHNEMMPECFKGDLW